MDNHLDLSIAQWKYGKDWVYSITYDEGLAELAEFVIPTHQALGIPGHVEIVAGHIGDVRNIGQSSFNGMRHMNGEELKTIIAMGWGVGCHSWSHEIVMDDPDRELRQAREKIEEVICHPVTIYTAPGSNENLTDEVLDRLPGYGFLAGMSITDDINRPDDADLLWVNRVPLHERYWGYFDSAYDAHKRIRQAQLENGWIVDYCHCPMEKAVHDYKDCSAERHRQRLETIVSEGRNNCWYANPDDVVDYRYVRRHSRIETIDKSQNHFRIRVDSLPEQVQHRELTFNLTGTSSSECPQVFVDGVPVSATPGGAGVLQFTVPAHDNMDVLATQKR